MGEKTNVSIGRNTYLPEESDKPSKFKNSPQYTIGKSIRKGLNLNIWTKNETYAIVSSVGYQKNSRKISEPYIKVGKSTRDINEKLGMFKSMMNKGPYQIGMENYKN